VLADSRIALRLALLTAALVASCGHDWTNGGDADAADDASTDADGHADVDGDGNLSDEASADAGPRSCRTREDCAGAPCVDGYCCDAACEGSCETCDLAGSEGRCTPVPAGQDPDSECSAESPSTCGQDGTCDGSGGCDHFGPETSCDDGTACTGGDFCDGAGACTGTPIGCDPAPGNECCAGRCDAAAAGCVTDTGACPDECGTDVLTVGRTCSGCGPAFAAGTCVGGISTTCGADSGLLCATAECGDSLWICTNAGGSWAWRIDPACDDGIDCTTDDTCSASDSCTGTAETGALLLATPGESLFTVPCYHSLTVVVRGGGGGGGTSYFSGSTAGATGGSSSFQSVRADGGRGGRGSTGGFGCPSATDGAGGTATGGATNITGSSGRDGDGGAGGGPGGGAGGPVGVSSPGSPGSSPGGAGGGGSNINCGGGGGGGGYALQTYSPGMLPVGTDLPVVVGEGGLGGTRSSSAADGGDGAPGSVQLDWN
jgi:hypothetical protein